MRQKIFHFIAVGCVSMGLASATIYQADEPIYLDGKDYHNSAFIVTENKKILKKIGKCEDRHAPFSTFKVPLALMGFDAGILETENSPVWSFKKEYEKNFKAWYTPAHGAKFNWLQDHTPATFMKNSVLWFSHQITQKLGKEKFQAYITKINYGNKDISGTPGKDDSLINSWLGTSLKISPQEQLEFLEKLLANELDVSIEAQEKTRKIMDRGEDWDGWKLYGKTGGGDNGWFIGWIEKDGRRIVFVQYIELIETGADKFAGPIAKIIAKENVLALVGK